MSLTSTDLELVVDRTTQQTVGLRFTGLIIPNGAMISNAYVQFQADETNSGSISLTIHGEDTDSAATFSSNSGDISSRTLTAASVGWSPPDWTIVGEAGLDQRTPDIAPIIQEIVNRSGWSSGNALAIIISGSGERTAESFEGAQAPLLHVEFIAAGGDQPPNVTITQPSNNATFNEDDSIAFNANANDLEEGDVSASLVWTSSLTGQISTGPSFSASLAVGTHTITATAMDSVPQAGSNQVTITVDPAVDQAPNVTITQPSNNATFNENNSITFSANASDPEEGDVSASLVWTSSLTGQIGTGPLFFSIPGCRSSYYYCDCDGQCPSGRIRSDYHHCESG